MKERHSPLPLIGVQKPGNFALRVGDNSVVNFLLQITLWDQAELRCPVFSGLSILALEDHILGKLGQLVFFVFC